MSRTISWMGSDRGDLQPAAAGQFREFTPQFNHMRARVLDRIANLGAELDHRLVHLGFDLLLEQDFAALENLLNVRPQLARLRIDNRELFFDTEGVSVVLGAHCGAQMSLKTNALSSRVTQTINGEARRTKEARTLK
jgi:hypothetical protein